MAQSAPGSDGVIGRMATLYGQQSLRNAKRLLMLMLEWGLAVAV